MIKINTAEDLAFLYWDMVYFEFADDSLKKFIIQEVEKYAKMIPDDAKNLRQAFQQVPELKEAYHSDNELVTSTFKFAEKLATKPKESLTGIKRSLRESYRTLAKEVKQWDIDEMVKTILSDNTQEGFLSIKEKRRPKFT